MLSNLIGTDCVYTLFRRGSDITAECFATSAASRGARCVVHKGVSRMARSSSRAPGFGHWFLHIRKTFRLLGALLRDPRVPGIRKFFFLATVVIFGVVLLIPDSIIVAALGIILPFAGPLIGIPPGLIDIAALSVASYGLLRFFPRAVVDEQAQRLYGPHPDIVPHTQARTDDRTRAA
jgi:hypothetical protein